MKNSVNALVAWEGRLVSGHESGKLLVWNVATSGCDQIHEGHDAVIRALAMCGMRLASGSRDTSIKLWTMGTGSQLQGERTLLGSESWVYSLAN
jgi:WD40 repeat protein